MAQQQQNFFDFGEIARTALGVANMLETRHRNDLYEQNVQRQAEQFRVQTDLNRQKLLLDQQQEQRALRELDLRNEQFKVGTELKRDDQELDRDRLKAQQQKMHQDSVLKFLDHADKVKKDPMFAMNRNAMIDLAMAETQALQSIGVEMQAPTREELAGGLEQYDRLTKALRSNDPEERRAALEDVSYAIPDWALRNLDIAKKAGELDVQGETLRTKIELNKARLQKMNAENGRLQLEQGIIMEHVGGVGRVLDIVDNSDLAPHFKNLMAKSPEGKQAYLNLHPEAKAGIEKALIDDKINLIPQVELMREQLNAKTQAVATYAAQHEGYVPPEMQREVADMKTIYLARQAEADWIDDVFQGNFDKDKLTAMRGQHEALRIEGRVRANKIQKNTDDNMALKEAKFDLDKHKADLAERADLATTFTQQEFLRLHEAHPGWNEDRMWGAAMKASQQKFPDTPIDISKLKNFEKANTLSVGITTDTKGQLEKNVLSHNLTVSTIQDLRKAVEENPTAVGGVGNFKRFMGGIAQQTFDVARSSFGADANMTPKARGMFEDMFTNTDPEDKIQALAIGLTYNVARQLSGSGTMSDMDIKAAKDLVGGLKNAGGARQFLNHLSVIETEMGRRARQSSEALETGKMPAVSGPTAPGGGIVLPATAEDYLKTLGIGQ